MINKIYMDNMCNISKNICNKCANWDLKEDKPRNKLKCMFCDGHHIERTQPLDKSK